ncbi:unnamed protein product [Lymnaea stagnalis]|uniref:Uncharacterized protein n=1 Tax=Lymnaea stagnalis TaxID=6523 RepID=A0AAV2I1G8_LYMST
MLLLWLVSLDVVAGLSRWEFHNVNLRDAEPKDEVMSFSPDMEGIRILDESMCRSTTTQVRFRLMPLKKEMRIVEKDKQEDFLKSPQPCNYTSHQSKCGVCWQSVCQSNISLPCKSLLGVSRWESTLELDVLIDQGVVVDCSVMCADIGFFEDDSYSGGNGITMVGIGFAIAIVLAIGLFLMLGVIIYHKRIARHFNDNSFIHPYKQEIG